MSDSPLQSNFTAGKGDNITTLYRGVGEISTTLAEDLLTAEVELCLVVDATGASQSGIAVCEDEIFFFAERLNKDRVLILTRGINGTTAVDHLSGTIITLYPRFFIPQAWQDTVLGMQNDNTISPQTADFSAAIEDRNKIITNEGAGTLINLTLPDAMPGLIFTYYVQNNKGIRITASGDDTIRIGASVSDTAGHVDSSTVGDYIVLCAINLTEWIALSPIQNWTVT